MSQKNNTRGRPRSKAAWNSVISATQKLLAEVGYAQLTMEGIAKEAKVGKPTLYRWWSGIPDIVMEVMKQYSEKEIQIPDTGQSSTDLEIYLRKTCQILSEDAGKTMRSLMAEAQLNETFSQQFREKFIDSRRSALLQIIKRGKQRGEINDNMDSEFIADLCYGPIWYRLLNQHAPLDEKLVSSIITSIIR